MSQCKKTTKTSKNHNHGEEEDEKKESATRLAEQHFPAEPPLFFSAGDMKRMLSYTRRGKEGR